MNACTHARMRTCTQAQPPTRGRQCLTYTINNCVRAHTHTQTHTGIFGIWNTGKKTTRVLATGSWNAYKYAIRAVGVLRKHGTV